jgi:Lantibiotic dehydratase, N terminus
MKSGPPDLNVDDDTLTNPVPLGRTGWALWRDVALRSAGFPAERFLEICDDELAEAADLLHDGVPATEEHYAKVFAAATDRLIAVIRRAATAPTFREAVTWQNPGVVRDCLDKVAAGEPRNSRGRSHELTIASYHQRYLLKNDTIGFFGPFGWARIGTEDTGVSVVPGPNLLSRRTTYFEGWAIDAVADAVANIPEVWPWLRPRMVPSATLTGRVVRLPFQKPMPLSAEEARVIGQCDGRRAVRDIAGDPPDPGTVAALLGLRALGAVRIDLRSPLVLRPELALAERIDAIADVAVRARARRPLDELVRHRDAVAAAAGEPDRLMPASVALADTFERITGVAATRRSGSTYAGRTLVYEDTVRAVEVHVGRRVTDRLSGPLGLVLDSALWLANTIGDRYEAKARELFDRELARTGGKDMPWLNLLTAVMPEFGQLSGGRNGSGTVDEVVAEFQQRWRRVVELPCDGFDRTRHHVTAEAISGRAAREFSTGPPRWSGARWYSPDVMLAATDDAALGRGEVHAVLGELHCAGNTLESQALVAQHPQPDRLVAAAVASQPGRRMLIIARTGSPSATSRMTRSAALMLPTYTYVCIGAESMAPPPPATVVSALDLVVVRRGDELVVLHPGSGAEYGFLDAAGDPLSVLIADQFRPFGAGRHRPRVTIDDLVVSRAAWTFPATEPTWAFATDERQRYARARRWRAEYRLPERGFVRVPVERKPTAVDFRSLPLVNLLAKSIRRTAEAGSGEVTITEMLPDIDRLWLPDAEGRRYTAELRMVAVRR